MALSILQTRRKEPETQKCDVASSSGLGFEPPSVWLCPFWMSHGPLLIRRAYLCPVGGWGAVFPLEHPGGLWDGAGAGASREWG